MTDEVLPPTVDELFDARADERDGVDIDRDFWSSYLRDLHDYNEELLASKPDEWIDARATEEMRA